jgi:hypothetical protein
MPHLTVFSLWVIRRLSLIGSSVFFFSYETHRLLPSPFLSVCGPATHSAHFSTVITINNLHSAVNFSYSLGSQKFNHGTLHGWVLIAGFRFMHNSKTACLTQQLATNWGERVDAAEHVQNSASVLPFFGRVTELAALLCIHRSYNRMDAKNILVMASAYESSISVGEGRRIESLLIGRWIVLVDFGLQSRDYRRVVCDPLCAQPNNVDKLGGNFSIA